MKQTAVLLGILCFMSFTVSDPVLKTYKVEATKEQWIAQVNRLNGIRDFIVRTNLGYQDVNAIISAIDSIQTMIVPQLNTQFLPVPTDTTKLKK